MTTLHTGTRTSTVGADWTVWDTAGRLVVTDPWRLEQARAVLERELAGVGRIVWSADGGGPGAARGGPAITPFPYGVATAPANGPVHVALPVAVGHPRGGWLHRGPGELRLGRGPTLPAWTAQRCAEAVAAATHCGALVAIGSDAATSGLAPVGGWRVRLPPRSGCAPTVLAIDGGAVSGVDTVRPGRIGLRRLVVPATGRTVRTWWRAVTVLAATGPAASEACAGALLRGLAAPAWLADLGLAARLVDTDGRLLDVGRWPGRARQPTHPRH